jgi:hypothetical protein
MGGQCFITAFIRNRELTLPPPHEPSGRNPESDILLSLRSNLILSFHSQLCLYVLSSVRIIGLTCRSIYCRFHAASHGACPRLVHSASCAAPAPLGTFFDHPVSCFVYAQHLLVAGPVLGLPHPFHTHTQHQLLYAVVRTASVAQVGTPANTGRNVPESITRNTLFRISADRSAGMRRTSNSIALHLGI